MYYCSKCGNELYGSGVSICPRCGARLSGVGSGSDSHRTKADKEYLKGKRELDKENAEYRRNQKIVSVFKGISANIWIIVISAIAFTVSYFISKHVPAFGYVAALILFLAGSYIFGLVVSSAIEFVQKIWKK